VREERSAETPILQRLEDFVIEFGVHNNALCTRVLGLEIGKILNSYLKGGKESWLIIGVEGVSGIKARI
jgi:hypothetical protein